MSKFGILDKINFIDTCNFCYMDIKANYKSIWYVNTQKNDFFLCNDCGETIGEKTDDNDVINSKTGDIKLKITTRKRRGNKLKLKRTTRLSRALRETMMDNLDEHFRI
jgi:hypothetical protein